MFVGKKAAAMVAASNYAVAEASRENARQIAQSNDRLAGTLKENSEREVAARDRVDITLAEYLKLKQDIAELSEENRQLIALCGKIGLPYNVPVITDSIRKYTCMGSPSVFDFTQKFLIEFSCDMSQLSPQQQQYMSKEFVYV